MRKDVILVVEDEELNRAVFRDALQVEGYEVFTASGTAEAVAVLDAREVSAVVCDIHMPHNGVKLFEYLLKNYPHLEERFVFVTGDPSRAAALAGLARPAKCLFRPFPIRDLIDTVRGALPPEPVLF